jgi:hypothetical protein
MSGGVDEQAPPRRRAQDDPLIPDALEDRLLTERDDRWAWRKRIRANPHQLRVYRAVIAAIGLLLVLLGLATGWLPGPGGIPLILGGLAVWASEFHWAHRLMLRLKHALHVYQSWSGRRKLVSWLVFLAACGLIGWGCLALVGPPTWIPIQVDRVLAVLPGVEIPA